MEDVIYSVAIGSRYVRLAQMMVDSLRWAGWSGRVIVYADVPVRGAETIEFNGSVTQAMMYRASVWLERPIDCSRALYCDCDILWHRSPQALFDYATDAETHYAFSEGLLKDGDALPMTHYLADREISDHHPAYNSGCICASRRCWIEGAGQWIVDDYIGCDQAAFNKAAVRREIRVEPFPDEWISFNYGGRPTHPEAVLEHHLSAGKAEMAARYRMLQEANNAIAVHELAKNPACRAAAAERLQICSACPSSASIDDLGVVCKAAGGRRLSPYAGICKLRKWPGQALIANAVRSAMEV